LKNFMKHASKTPHALSTLCRNHPQCTWASCGTRMKLAREGKLRRLRGSIGMSETRVVSNWRTRSCINIKYRLSPGRNQLRSSGQEVSSIKFFDTDLPNLWALNTVVIRITRHPRCLFSRLFNVHFSATREDSYKWQSGPETSHF
jgi:hypothetical protein